MVLGKAAKDVIEQPSFRSFKSQTLARRELDLEWSNAIKEKFKAGADLKQLTSLEKERKRLQKLDLLKKSGGPFTNAEQVLEYLYDMSIPEKIKQQRMKSEIQFARDSSTTLPKVDPLFKVQVVIPNKKRRDKNSAEFGEALVAFLGKKAERVAMDYSAFQTSLDKVIQ